MNFTPKNPSDGFITRLWKAAYNIYVVFRFVLGGLIAVVVVGAVFAIAQGLKQDWNIGALLNFLLGNKKPSRKDTVNEVSKGRKDKKGKLIPIGVEDKKGYAQQEQKEFKVSNNPLRDKSEITLSDGTAVPLPVGVKDTDVEEIVYVPANKAYVVKVRDTDTSPVSTGDVLDMMNKKEKNG